MTEQGDGFAELPEDAPQPAQSRTPTEFTASLRSLRIWSGLTYRQLEDKATANADTLPASTIASTLGRVTLPREGFVDAYTRACGLGAEEVRQWREARRRIAGNEPVSNGAARDDDPDTPITGAPAPASVPRWRRVAPLLGAAAIGAAGTLGVRIAMHDASTPAALPDPMQLGRQARRCP